MDSNKIIYDVNNKEYTLSNVIKEGGRIIIRYSELNCNVCIDSLFSCIDNHLNKKEKQQIHILASYHMHLADVDAVIALLDAALLIRREHHVDEQLEL